jgi:hypothetical protein
MARTDARSTAGLLLAALALCGAPDALAKKECSNDLKDRSAAQVMAAHRAAIAAQDWQAVGCDYAQDAVVIHDQGVTVGRDAIVNDLRMISGLFAGINPTVHQEVIAPILKDKDMVRLLWSISTQCMDIEDGADTYIVGDGKIHAQTAHGFPSFRCQP